MESFRFVHAARLMLDHQLHGAGPLPEVLRPTVEDATLTAFDRVIDACLTHEVDALLVAVDSFDRCDQGLRGPSALVSGFERLAARNIAVILIAGRTDPWAAWPEGMRFPANVRRLGFDGLAETPLSRQGRLTAIVRTPHTAVDGSSQPQEDEWRIRLPERMPDAFSVVLAHGEPACATDCGYAHDPASPLATGGFVPQYTALGGNAARRTLEIDGKIVHDPGPAQAVRPLESGVRGCTLVEVDTSGSAKMAFLPTCSVRYEQLSVRVFPETTREMLVQAMVRALKAVERFPTDKVWLVAWNVSGAGDLIDALSPGRARDEILAAASTKGDVPGVHVHSHAVRLYRTGVLAPPAADELTGEFDARLTSGFAETTWTPARCLAESPLRGGPWQNPLGILLSELDEREVARDARQVGRDWFAPQEEPLS